MSSEDIGYSCHPSKRSRNDPVHTIPEAIVNSSSEKYMPVTDKDAYKDKMAERNERIAGVKSPGCATDPVASSTGYDSGFSPDSSKMGDADIHKDSTTHSTHDNDNGIKNASKLEDEIGIEAVTPPLLTPGGAPLMPALNRWIHRQRSSGCVSLRRLFDLLLDDLGLELALVGENASELEIETFFTTHEERLWHLLKQLLLWQHHAREKMRVCSRSKLLSVNTLEDAVHLIMKARHVLVISGAGISVSCGIPDFRSKGGIYSMLGEYDLPSPESMFDLRYFRCNPVPFFQFARELLPGKYSPSPTHYFIKLLDQKGKLLRNYTQNIDGLEIQAGVSEGRVHQCHGSFSTATCQNAFCGRRVRLSDIEDRIRAQKLPMCETCCDPSGILKPDIVFFGEPLGNVFAQKIKQDRLNADLVIVMGSSLQVAPVNHIMNWIPSDTPQILINREVVGGTSRFDVELLGDSDDVVRYLCQCLEQLSSVSQGGRDSEGNVLVQDLSSPHVAPKNEMGWTLDGVDSMSCGESQASVSPPIFHPPSTYLFLNAKPKPPQRMNHEALFDLDEFGPVDLQALQKFGPINKSNVDILPSKATSDIHSAEIGDSTVGGGNTSD